MRPSLPESLRQRIGQAPRLLLVRTDKIGDLVLTTPALAAIKEAHPKSSLTFLCRSYAAPVLENHPAVSQILTSDSFSSSGDLAKKLFQENFDASIHFYLDRRSEIAAWRAKIPLRIGPFSKWTGIFLNRRLCQSRSRVEKHEAQYNLELAEVLGASGNDRAPEIFLTEAEKKRGREILAVYSKGKAIIIHPGSAGSVQNWPLENFIELGRKLAESGREVVFTAGKGEESILQQVESKLVPRMKTIPAGSLSLRELMGVLSAASLVISNSTGPLHMANALGTPTLSFYPHLPLVTSAKRWGPLGNPERNIILSPPNPNAPMNSVSVDKAFGKLQHLPLNLPPSGGDSK